MNTLCILRDIYRSIRDFDENFQQKHNLCLNEAMLLCSLKGTKMTSSQLANALGLTTSNMSKVIKSVENKRLVERILGEDDKRQMYFCLSQHGNEMLSVMRLEEKEMVSLLNRIEVASRQSTDL